MNLIPHLFVTAVSTFAVVFPIYLINAAITGSKKRRQKAVDKAIQKKHVVRAALVKKVFLYPNRRETATETWGRTSYRATYEYIYNGHQYKYRKYCDLPPQNVTLYFLKSPRKATEEYQLLDSNVNWPLLCFLVGLFFWWVSG